MTRKETTGDAMGIPEGAERSSDGTVWDGTRWITDPNRIGQIDYTKTPCEPDSGVPGGDKGVPWDERSAPGRISPRECIRNAQDDMNKAWCQPNGYAAMEFIRGSVDWLRRALEQMAPEDSDA